MGICFGVIATTRPFDPTMPGISDLCDGHSGLSGLVVVANYPHEPRSSKHLMVCSKIAITVIDASDYLGSAEAFRRGISVAQSAGADAVLLLDDDCVMDTASCRALCEAVQTYAIVSANRNGHRETWVVPGVIRVLRPARTSHNILCGWAGTALNLNLIPQWDAWLRQLGQTLWFYWDDYTFVGWVIRHGLEVYGLEHATFTSPRVPRTQRAHWRSYYESRNAVWFARWTLTGFRQWKFIVLWFVEYVVGIGLRDARFRETWKGFWDGISGVSGRCISPDD